MRKTIPLKENWEILSIPKNSKYEEASFYFETQPVKEEWIPAREMPAQVHDILIDNGLTENFALQGKCDQFEWVAQKDWLYRCRFSCQHPEEWAQLCFAGLDTFVTIYLNGQEVASHQSMYRALMVDVTGKLQQENT